MGQTRQEKIRQENKEHVEAKSCRKLKEISELLENSEDTKLSIDQPLELRNKGEEKKLGINVKQAQPRL